MLGRYTVGQTLLVALAMVFVIEGIGPMLFPNSWKNYLSQVASQPSEQLRTIGGAMVTIGLVALFFLLPE
ncbi:DUF2065 domain-containing protein [Aliiglaciecola sp. LCG003]|uniref:DUF2065 domain-containing protein n=1 Tax=Aliiglaciecola sp. LCG003 TaxID=3053655 RepID=UPI0025729538|nr:DUF2065 domain-containing protein [Aliiglaciecola sp. LCG003]WJG09074.1 DUF2065 domain-containing protein [Aliiglaciecola sp. LCG003]